jgi:hypothetical protein
MVTTLLSQASPFNLDDRSATPPKKVPSLLNSFRKTLKKVHFDEEADSQEPFTSMSPSTLDEVDIENKDRVKRIESVIQKMSQIQPDNEGSGLANFQPLDHPVLQQKPVLTVPPLQSMSFAPTLTSPSPNKESFYSKPLGKPIPGSSYQQVYSQAPVQQNMARNDGDTRLMEKLNYMIRLLEEQQHEQTQNITEEFILYGLLGVFMIYLVDSFARVGKYVR